MPDNKLTDNEIIKALECCIEKGKCNDCPCYLPYGINCAYHKNKTALDLINRLQAENSNLTSDLTSLRQKFDNLQAENDDLFYKLTGVMHSVDKWLDGAEGVPGLDEDYCLMGIKPREIVECDVFNFETNPIEKAVDGE